MGIMGSLSFVSSLLSVDDIESVNSLLLMSGFVLGVLGEKIVVCLFLVGITKQRVSNMSIMGDLSLVSSLLSVSNIKSVSSLLFVG